MACSPVPKVGGAAAPSAESAPAVPTPVSYTFLRPSARPSVCLLYSYTLLKPFDEFKCHLAVK